MQCKTCSGTSWGRWWLPTNSTDFAYKKNGTDIYSTLQLCLGHGRGTSTTLNWHCRPGKQNSDIQCTILFPLLGSPASISRLLSHRGRNSRRLFISSLTHSFRHVRIYHLTRTTGEPDITASFLSSGSDESFPFKSSRTGVNLWTHIKLQDGISWYHVYKLYFWPPCNWATMWLELLEKLLKVAMRIPPAIRSSIVKKAGNSLTWVELL